MTDASLVSYAVNLTWMASAAAMACAAGERLEVRPVTRERWWTAGLLLAVFAPLGGLLLPAGAAGLPDLRFTAASGRAVTSGTSPIHWTQLMATIYALSVAFAAARLCWRWARLSRLTEHTAATPLTFGVLRPRVLIPAVFGREASPLAIETALAHERVHVERADFLRNLAIEFATLPAAFHPAVWYMKARLAQARELVCDELAACAIGDRRRYAQGLIEAARAIAHAKPPRVRLAMSMLDHTDFEERIIMLNQPPAPPSHRGLVLLGALLALAPAMTVSGFYFQEPDPIYKIGNGTSTPKLVYKEEPRYSDAAEAAKVEGTVALRTVIGKGGMAENIKVIRKLHPDLDANAVECVKKWRFEPGMRDGMPVRVLATIEVNFKLK